MACRAPKLQVPVTLAESTQLAQQRFAGQPSWLAMPRDKLRSWLQKSPQGPWASWKLYAGQRCLPAGFALGLLYCSVLSPGLLMNGAHSSACTLDAQSKLCSSAVA